MTDANIHPCRICGKDEADGYPHRHDTPPRPEHNPMPKRPPTLGETIAIIRREYRMELPVRLHSRYVPGRLEPIGVSEYSAAAGGYVATERSIEVSDTGELGSPSWSPEAHRRFGGVTVWGDAMTVAAADYAVFPWAYALERRIPGWCRRGHLTRPEAYSEHAGRVLCPDLVRLVVVTDTPFMRGITDLGVTPERAVDLLEPAVAYLWRCVSDALNEIDLRRKVA